MAQHPSSSLTFEDYDDSGEQFGNLRSQLKVVDKAIDLLKQGGAATASVEPAVAVSTSGQRGVQRAVYTDIHTAAHTAVQPESPPGRRTKTKFGRGLPQLREATASASITAPFSASASQTRAHTLSASASTPAFAAASASQPGFALAAMKDMSHTIDTTSTQMGTCPHCFQEMELTKLRKHLAAKTSTDGVSMCPNKEMTCPESGCGARFPAHMLKRHLAKECEVARYRRNLVDSGAQRKLAGIG